MGIANSIISRAFRKDPRKRLLCSLRGRAFTIPDLQATFAHWPQGINPEVDRLADAVDERLDLYFPRGKIGLKMQEAGVAEFGASWWPYAPFDRLCIATYLSLWLFAWDDETDSTEISDMVHHNDRAAVFRQQTKQLIHASLSDDWEEKELQLPGGNSPLIANFSTVGRAIAESSSSDQKGRFLDELDLFVDMTDLEQRVQSSNKLPTVEEYLHRRMGSSAVGVCLAITEYAYGMEIPTSVMNEEPIRRLWYLTNVIISTTNDIMSVKKEIAHDQVDSLIPLLYSRHGSLQKAIDVAASMVTSSVAEFDQVSGQVLKQHLDDKDLSISLKQFIEGCHYACTANLNWGLRSARYKLPSDTLKGSLLIKLD